MKAEEKIYETYLNSRTPKLYFNQLKKLTSLSNSSLQNILNRLVKDKILSVDKGTSNTFYQIKNKKRFSLEFSKVALNLFSNLNFDIQVPLTNFLKEAPKDIFTIVLFGSASRNEQKKGSDIDLLIVRYNKTNLEKIKREVNNISN